MIHSLESYYNEQSLQARADALEEFLQEIEISELEKQEALMDFLDLLRNQRAANVGVRFSERLTNRVADAFHAHPASEVAVDLLYSCLLVQQFHAMNFDQWRADPYIQKCKAALISLEADQRLSDCFRFCQETANTYAEARFWPEALDYAVRAHQYVKKLLRQKVFILENGEMLDLRDTAYLICEYALHTEHGISGQLEAMLQVDIGAEDFQFVRQEAMDAVEDTATDPVEFTPQYLAIRFELEEKIDEALDHQRGYYNYIKDYWMAKKLILRTEYGISWKSPAALNPADDFD